jgi:hypothetical protein
MLSMAFLVAASPMLSYALSHPDEWNTRINQVGILQSGWLAREPSLTGKSTSQILAGQFLRAAGAFHVFPDRTVWYGADRPLLGFLAGALGVLGMAWTICRWRERRSFLLLTWFWSVIITGGMLTESPPSSQRLVMAAPAVAVLVALGLEQSILLFARLFGPGHSPLRSAGFSRQRQNAALGALLALIAVMSLHFYFVEYTPERRYGSENGETATMIGHYLRELAGDCQVFFLGAPRIYWNFGTMSFLAPSVPGEDIVEPLVGPPHLTVRSGGAVFVALPERAKELDRIETAYPKGTWRRFYDTGGDVRFVAYEIPLDSITPEE